MSNDLFDGRVTRGDYPCPWCDELNDAAVSLNEPNATPEAGDIALCMSCSRPSVYQEHGKPRRPTESEWAKLNDDDNITALRKQIFMSNHGNVNYQSMGIDGFIGGDE